MAEKKKEPTPEEQRVTNVKDTLEFKLLQESVGSNLIKTNPALWGEFGVMSANDAYNQAMNTPEAQKERKNLTDQKELEYKRYGVFGEAFVPNSDLSLKLAKQLDEVMHMATFGEIEKYAKDLGAKLTFKVPDEMKNYSINEIMKTALDKEKGTVDLDKLSDSYKEAFNFYEKILSNTYKRACSANIAKRGNYFADINAAAEQLGEKYQLPKEAPKEDKKAEKGKEKGKK
jgi:hypothetical protein